MYEYKEHYEKELKRTLGNSLDRLPDDIQCKVQK